MELIWSTATFSTSNSKTWSASVVWFSNAMWYWKPEQPPPTTATRSATGTGLCMLMISLTLVLATGVKLIINSLGLRSRGVPANLSIVTLYQNFHTPAQSHVPVMKRLVSPHFDKHGCFAYNKMQ